MWTSEQNQDTSWEEHPTDMGIADGDVLLYTCRTGDIPYCQSKISQFFYTFKIQFEHTK
jgi:hypothetical protein